MEEENKPSNFVYLNNTFYYMLIILVSNFILFLYFKAKRNTRELVNQIHDSLGNKEALIVIAHPDDETIFFFPTMYALISKSIKVNILCLSNGNYYNLGKIREKEMQNLCKHLKLNSVEMINNDKLKDDLLLSWDAQIVANEISNYIQRNDNKIGVIFTFDSKGVSKHPNHISVYDGIR
jgi:N-acetylglucosaminylphosphatidylinositol deacetylase